MIQTDITEREFKAACLRCLLRGSITDTERATIAAYCDKERKIIQRAATVDEENELETARRENKLNEFLARPYNVDETPINNLFDRAVYLKAVKLGFDAVKDWFKGKFGGRDIEIVWFGDVKPNLNPNANPKASSK